MSSGIECPIECIRGACPDAPDFLETNSTFLLTALASLSACCGVVLSYFLKSRCRIIKTPCLSCERDVLDLTVRDVVVQ